VTQPSRSKFLEGRTRDYQVPFRFTGKLNKLTVEEGPIKGTLAQILEFKWKTRD